MQYSFQKQNNNKFIQLIKQLPTNSTNKVH